MHEFLIAFASIAVKVQILKNQTHQTSVTRAQAANLVNLTPTLSMDRVAMKMQAIQTPEVTTTAIQTRSITMMKTRKHQPQRRQEQRTKSRRDKAQKIKVMKRKILSIENHRLETENSNHCS